MSYQISASDLKHVRWSESDTVNSVIQNIAIILSTPLGSVPLYREFGLDMTFVDKPEPVARVLMIAAVQTAIPRWEPRAAVRSVTPQADPDRPGKLRPLVEVDISLDEE